VILDRIPPPPSPILSCPPSLHSALSLRQSPNKSSCVSCNEIEDSWRRSDSTSLCAAMFPHHSSTLCSAASGTATNAQAPHPALERAALATGLGRGFLGSDPFRRLSLPANINYKANFIAAYVPAAATSSRLANMSARRRPEQLLSDSQA
jgi:hypothetical protein